MKMICGSPISRYDNNSPALFLNFLFNKNQLAREGNFCKDFMIGKAIKLSILLMINFTNQFCLSFLGFLAFNLDQNLSLF